MSIDSKLDEILASIQPAWKSNVDFRFEILEDAIKGLGRQQLDLSHHFQKCIDDLEDKLEKQQIIIDKIMNTFN